MGRLELHDDRLLPVEPSTRAVARDLYEEVRNLPIVSMHGHVDAGLLAEDQPFSDPVALLVTPDHYVTRVLHSQGVPLEALGLRRSGTGTGAHHDRSSPAANDAFAGPRAAWREFCRHWPALAGTASYTWLTQQLTEIFGVAEEPGVSNADALYDQIAAALERSEHRPRALCERFGIEVLATTDSPLDDLSSHQQLRAEPQFSTTVLPTFRPDEVLDPDRPTWRDDVERLGARTGRDVGRLGGLLEALQQRRSEFAAAGARSTDHAHPTARTLVSTEGEADRIYARLLLGRADSGDGEAFRAYMLGEMARMSCDDGLVLQLHAGVYRDHDGPAAARFGHDIGADFPVSASFTEALRPLLETYGTHPNLTLVAYTVDEAAYGRELAAMASYYPALRLGAPWWFLDAPDAMRRCWRAAVETAGVGNFAGFVDDARALCSIPARHDMARRVVCGELARLVVEHRLQPGADRAAALAYAYQTPKLVFRW